VHTKVVASYYVIYIMKKNFVWANGSNILQTLVSLNVKRKQMAGALCQTGY